MSKKLTGKALANFEAKRDVWQEVLDGLREIKAGGGKRTTVEVKCALSQEKFAAALGVWNRTLEQWRRNTG